MFNNSRYLTCGVDATIPLALQLFLWKCVDSLPAPKDHLQIFDLQPVGQMQNIIHRAEEPEYHKEYLFLSENPIAERCTSWMTGTTQPCCLQANTKRIASPSGLAIFRYLRRIYNGRKQINLLTLWMPPSR